jgi:nucleotide-binding universal stress UspA family protein
MPTNDARGAVVVGYDVTPHSELALDWAAHHAATQHRPLLIVHAIAPPHARDALGVGMYELRKEMRVVGRRYLDGALARVRAVEPGIEVKEHLAFGSPHEVLLESLGGAHLLVVGSRGRGTLASLLLGSVSVSVAASAPCAVAVVRVAEARGDSPTFSGRVAVGVDGSAASLAALDLAFALASTRGSGVGVVHSWGPVAVRRDLTRSEQRRATVEEHELQVAESLAGLAETYPDVDVTTHQAEEDPRRALEDASRYADLLVVGSRGRGATKSIVLGSVSRHVVEHAHCPVLVVRAPD